MLKRWRKSSNEETKPLLTDPFGRLPGPNGTWETKQERRRRRISIGVSIFTMFLSAVMFSITLPSMVYFYDIIEGKPYTEYLDVTAQTDQENDVSFYSLVVAAFSVGQALASPPFGWWFDKHGARQPYVMGLFCLMGGSLMYSLSLNIWMMMAARFIVGVGAGIATVARAHVGNSTDLTESTGAMAGVAAAQAVGLIGGPSFALIFNNVNVYMGAGFYFDTFTGPGYVSAFLAFINIICVLFFFVEAPKPDENSNVPSINGSAMQTPSKPKFVISEKDKARLSPWGYDFRAAMICMYVFFCVTSAFSVFETIGSPFTRDNLKWGVPENSLFFSLAALQSLVVFIFIKPVAARLGDRASLVLGQMLMAAGLFARLNFTNEGGIISEVQYWTSTMCLYALGYPISSALSYGMLSKILGPVDQGPMIGWQQVAGSVARITGPLWAWELYKLDSRARYVFGTASGLCLSAGLLVLIFWKRMVPHPAVQAEIDAKARGMTSVVKATPDEEHGGDDDQHDHYDDDTSSYKTSRASSINRGD